VVQREGVSEEKENGRINPCSEGTGCVRRTLRLPKKRPFGDEKKGGACEARFPEVMRGREPAIGDQKSRKRYGFEIAAKESEKKREVQRTSVSKGERRRFTKARGRGGGGRRRDWR